MNRHELEFALTYSINLEQMHQTLFGRIDRLCMFCQLVLGTATVAKLVPETVSGSLVAVLASVQLVYQPGQKSQEAKLQKAKYFDLAKNAVNLADKQLQEAFDALSTSDSEVLGMLTHPSWLATSIQKGLPIQPADWKRLGFSEKVLSWLAGNCPKNVA